jgi:two-component sensor histidine kinase
VLKDASGQFVPLLHAALSAAAEAMRLRRAKETAEAELREQRDRFEKLAAERAMLLREVNHRVGNSLQLIAAFLQLQAGSSGNAEVKAALTDAQRRVMAVAQVHRRLYTSDDVQSVSVDHYLAALVDDLAKTDAAETPVLSLAAEPIDLDPDRAVAIGVIVNELVLNAMKYAYPAEKGPIRIGLKRVNGQHAVLSVEDDGIGISPRTAPRSTGLGRSIVGAMASRLGADVVYDSAHSGTRVMITFECGASPVQ